MGHFVFTVGHKLPRTSLGLVGWIKSALLYRSFVPTFDPWLLQCQPRGGWISLAWQPCSPSLSLSKHAKVGRPPSSFLFLWWGADKKEPFLLFCLLSVLHLTSTVELWYVSRGLGQFWQFSLSSRTIAEVDEKQKKVWGLFIAFLLCVFFCVPNQSWCHKGHATGDNASGKLAMRVVAFWVAPRVFTSLFQRLPWRSQRHASDVKTLWSDPSLKSTQATSVG